MLDAVNRNALIFSVEVKPIGVTNCPGSSGQPLVLTVDGDFTSGGTMNFHVSGSQPMAPSQVLLGLTSASQPLPTTPCTIYIGGILAGFPVVFADMSGEVTTTWNLPAFSSPRVHFTAQVAAVDAGLPISQLQIVLSNGVDIDIR